MKIKKSIIGIVCVILFVLFAYNSVVKAQDVASAVVDYVQAADGRLILYVNHNQGEEWQVSKENSALTVVDQSCEIESVQMLKNTDTPISYVCMVDISGSMNQARIDAIKEMLYQFVDGKKESDNVCVTLMGNYLTSSAVMQNSDEIKAYVDGITVTKEDTNLYQSIKEELAMMQKQQGLHNKKCLIIFSDGADDQTTGITREEAQEAVKESNIPVFTIAMLKASPTEAQMEAAKVLGSFARYSAGGQHYAPVIEKYENSEVYGKVQMILNSSLIITVPVEGLTLTGNTANVVLTLSNGSVAASAETNLSNDIVAEIGSMTMPEVVETELAEEVESETNGLDFKVILLIVMAVACVLGIVVMVVAKMRKEELEDELEYTKKANVSMAQVNGTGMHHEFVIKEEVKIGRGRRCQLCLKEDAALSEVHCSLQWRQGELYIKDENSTNGTYVNGVPIVGEYKLEMGDVLLIGSFEYRINWR